MTLPIIFGLVSLVSYFVGALTEYRLGKKRNTPVDFFELKFEHELNLADLYNHDLSPAEAAYQIRRIISTKVADYFFIQIMNKNNNISETIIDNNNATIYIRILPPATK